MILRPYQEKAIKSVFKGWEERQRQLMVMPTGAGKTVVFSNVAQQCSGKTLILAHREELINQAADKLHKATGVHAAIEMGVQKATPGHKTVVGSIQTMGRRLDKWSPKMFETIIIDEAHHALSDTYRKVVEHFTVKGNANLLGVTATPDRETPSPSKATEVVRLKKTHTKQSRNGVFSKALRGVNFLFRSLIWCLVRGRQGDVILIVSNPPFIGLLGTPGILHWKAP